MNSESIARIDSYLSACATDLFTSHGASLRPLHGKIVQVEDPFIASIGFTSASIRGVLVLTVSQGLAHKSLPPSLGGSAPKAEILADWTGELSNQMLGRLKSKFLQSGFEIALSTPMVFFGKELQHAAHRLPLNRSLSFEGDGKLIVEFQADFDPGFELGESSGAEAAGPPEGEVLFF